jgi:hypothetical protein
VEELSYGLSRAVVGFQHEDEARAFLINSGAEDLTAKAPRVSPGRRSLQRQRPLASGSKAAHAGTQWHDDVRRGIRPPRLDQRRHQRSAQRQRGVAPKARRSMTGSTGYSHGTLVAYIEQPLARSSEALGLIANTVRARVVDGRILEVAANVVAGTLSAGGSHESRSHCRGR